MAFFPKMLSLVSILYFAVLHFSCFVFRICSVSRQPLINFLQKPRLELKAADCKWATGKTRQKSCNKQTDRRAQFDKSGIKEWRSWQRDNWLNDQLGKHSHHMLWYQQLDTNTRIWHLACNVLKETKWKRVKMYEDIERGWISSLATNCGLDLIWPLHPHVAVI